MSQPLATTFCHQNQQTAEAVELISRAIGTNIIHINSHQQNWTEFMCIFRRQMIKKTSKRHKSFRFHKIKIIKINCYVFAICVQPESETLDFVGNNSGTSAAGSQFGCLFLAIWLEEKRRNLAAQLLPTLKNGNGTDPIAAVDQVQHDWMMRWDHFSCVAYNIVWNSCETHVFNSIRQFDSNCVKSVF